MRDERSPYDEKLDHILNAAASVFAAKGYHHASIRDIARQSEVSLSGLYYYVQSKEELLFLIQGRAFDTLTEQLEQRLDGVDDPRERLRILMENHITYFLDNMSEMKVLSHEADSLSGDFYRGVHAKKRRLVDIAKGVIRELRPDGPVDGRVATFAMFGMMNWIYTWHHAARDIPACQLADEMCSIFLEGFLNVQENSTVSGMITAEYSADLR